MQGMGQVEENCAKPCEEASLRKSKGKVCQVIGQGKAKEKQRKMVPRKCAEHGAGRVEENYAKQEDEAGQQECKEK